MIIEQKKYDRSWISVSDNGLKDSASLVLAFGGTDLIKEGKIFGEITSLYPNAAVLLCSSAGEILGTAVSDNQLSLTAIKLEKTTLKFYEENISKNTESLERGKRLSAAIDKSGLRHVMVFSDGLLVNGTTLVEGLTSQLPKNVSVTGGLVGDGARFRETLVGLNAQPAPGKIVVIAFYSQELKVGFGSLGGWDTFGPEREITKAKDNVLYEIDGKPALALYKQYLGEEAEGLPGSGLLFPLEISVATPSGDKQLVRTILNVDESSQSITFAGNMPVGSKARLMKANFERLIDGAGGAASLTFKGEKSPPQLAILISCIGRKLVLKERTEEELEAVRDTLGKETVLTGFYSYGEISPVAATESQCQLHNQTMTITTFKE